MLKFFCNFPVFLLDHLPCFFYSIWSSFLLFDLVWSRAGANFTHLSLQILLSCAKFTMYQFHFTDSIIMCQFSHFLQIPPSRSQVCVGKLGQVPSLQILSGNAKFTKIFFIDSHKLPSSPNLYPSMKRRKINDKKKNNLPKNIKASIERSFL